MSCSGSISPRGRSAASVMQGHTAGDYPLVAPSDDISALLADMYFAYDDAALYGAAEPEKKYPFSITRLRGASCLQDDADIEIKDANGVVVCSTFSAADAIRSATEWSDNYKIYEWRTPRAVCRIVIYKTWPAVDKEAADSDATTAKTYANDIFPAAAVIDARAVYRLPQRLLSLRVNTAGVITEKFAGGVVFKNGYNTEIATTETAISNFRESARIIFSGVAGSGLGKFYNCDDTTSEFAEITTINGAAPADTGDFLISARGCLWNTRPTINDAGKIKKDPAAAIKFGGDCGACCGCEDYSGAADYMNQVAYRYQLIGQRAQDVYTQHETNVALWTATACTTGEKLSMMIKSQQCGAIDVAITLCNTCDKCIPASTLLLELYLPEPADENVPTIDAWQGRNQSKNLHGNRLTHEIDCSYTKLSATTVDMPVDISGSFDAQFGAPLTIDASGVKTGGGGVRDQSPYPQIKPKSLVWPTLVTNVFTADSPTTEPITDVGAFGNQKVCGDANKPGPYQRWELDKNNPNWSWRDQFAAFRGNKYLSLYVYGIRIADSAILPASMPSLPNLRYYLAGKYLRPDSAADSQFPEVNWASVENQRLSTGDMSPTLLNPETHNRWWSPIVGHSSFGDDQVNGQKNVRVFELINEGGAAVIFSTAAGVLTVLERVGVSETAFGYDVNDIVVIGFSENDFETDVVPRIGLSVVDMYGLFSTWQPENKGVSNYFPAEIVATYVHTPSNPLSENDNFKTVYVFIKKPVTHNEINFPDISIDYDIYCVPDSPICWRVRSLAAVSFKQIRFYDMNFFTEHVQRFELFDTFLEPIGLPANATADSIASAAGTDLINNAPYSKPDRYIAAQNPRRITAQMPEVSPGATAQVDFRVLISEYRLLEYVTRTNPGDPFAETCDDELNTKLCEGSELTKYFVPLYDGNDRLHFVEGNWQPPAGADGDFYIHIPAGSDGVIQHVNGNGSTCPPTLQLSCDASVVPEYWRLLQFKKLFETTYPATNVPDTDELLGDYACSTAGVFDGVVTTTENIEADPPTVTVKICGFVYVSSSSILPVRKVKPKSTYAISAVLTGRKPTGSTADLSEQHIVDKACPGVSGGKKAIIETSVRLKCDELGRTPEC